MRPATRVRALLQIVSLQSSIFNFQQKSPSFRGAFRWGRVRERFRLLGGYGRGRSRQFALVGVVQLLQVVLEQGDFHRAAAAPARRFGAGFRTLLALRVL